MKGSSYRHLVLRGREIAAVYGVIHAAIEHDIVEQPGLRKELKGVMKAIATQMRVKPEEMSPPTAIRGKKAS